MMKWIVYLAIAAVIALGAVAIWVRITPVPDEALAFPQISRGVGDETRQTGFIAVRAPDDPEGAVLRMMEAADATPRTEIVFDEPYRFTAVTRSLVFGFPDVAHVWAEDGKLMAQSSLVIGKYDFGKNAERLRGWLAEAGL